MVRWSFDGWLVVLVLAGLCAALTWLDWQKPKTVYVPVPDNEIHVNGTLP